MSAAKLDLYIEQGATFKIQATLRDSSNALLDLTGATFLGQIRTTYSSNDVLATFSFTDLGASVIEASLTAVQTASLPVRKAIDHRIVITKYAYDIEMEQGGVVTRLLQGTVNLSPEVSRV